ncbi:MAG TPA: hypothetical protein ENN42_05070 [Thioalkalivibrio sp.]|nr:hypothetical protein [Thioalkalivibrio sp.]
MSLPRGTLHDELWLLRQNPDHYAIQALAISSEAAARGFYAQHAQGLQAAIARTQHQDQRWYVLVFGVYAEAPRARQAIASLPAPVRDNGPFVRRIGDLQEAILTVR